MHTKMAPVHRHHQNKRRDEYKVAVFGKNSVISYFD